MLDSNELDLAYMPYHEGLVNHNAPPLRTSLSVRVSNTMAPSYDEDDDASDDPAWMTAPRGSLQPAFPSSLMVKTSSVKKAQNHIPVSPRTDPNSSEDEHDKNMTKPDDDEDDDYFPPTMQSPARIDSPMRYKAAPRRSFNSDKLTTELKLRKSTNMPTNHLPANPIDANLMVNLGVPRNSRGNSEIDRLSIEKRPTESPGKKILSPESANQRPSHYQGRASVSSPVIGGQRESMMRYRPSDFRPQDMTMAMSRDSLAPENFESGRPTDMYGSRSSNLGFETRDSNILGLTQGTDNVDRRGSIMHFGPRVTEEGLSNYLRAVKAGNILLLRTCLQDRNTDFAERDPVHGQSAMHIAVRFGQFRSLQLLCSHKTRGLLIDAVDNRQNTPLHLAAAKSRRLTKYLLENGADASRINNRNQTPLAVHILTAKRDDPLIAEMLLQHKTDPNGSLGNSTLLHKAVEFKLFEIAYRLVRYGARMDAKDADGSMVFDKVDHKVLRQLCSKISYPPTWVPNMERKSCMICQRNFSRFGIVRRHHCRHCGRLICGRCSHVSVESEAFPTTFVGHIDRNASDERSNLKRVCKTCSSVFDERAKQAKENSPNSHRKWSSGFMEKFVGISWDKMEGNNLSTRGFN